MYDHTLDPGGRESAMPVVAPGVMAEPEWEYGFYDSEYPENPTIWWYVFGLAHKTADSAEHTGRKSTYGTPVIVRRRRGATEWEHNPHPFSAPASGKNSCLDCARPAAAEGHV